MRARALVEKAERMLDQASPEDQEEMVNYLEEIRQALDDHATDRLKAPCDGLSEILFYLET